MACRSKRRAQRNANFLHGKINKQGFVDLPIDVMVEVFQYLEPVDILYLARTTKALRAFLLDRHWSRQVWKTAFSNVPNMPPPRSEYLSEPVYAHLAFVPVCHGCFERCDAIEWELRIRLCSKCRLEKMTSAPQVFHTAPIQFDETLQKAGLVRLPVAKRHIELYEGNLEDIPMELVPKHLTSDWESLLERAQRSKRTIEAFVKKECKALAPIIEHAELCHEWEFQREKDVREKRMDEVKTKLSVLGWANEMDYWKPFWELPEVSKAEPLTSDEWNEISPKVIALLSRFRPDRIANIYRDRLRVLRDIARTVLAAKPIDLFLDPDIRHVLESDVDLLMDDDMVEHVLVLILHRIMRQQQDEAVDALTSLAQQQLGSKVSVKPSNVQFQCIRCKEFMTFNSALRHEHLYQEYTPEKRPMYSRMPESKIYEKVGKELYRSHFRNLDVLQASMRPQNKKSSRKRRA